MMRARWGRIIFISSVVGLHRLRPGRPTTRPRRPASSAWPARWPASSASRSITVNVVAPGPIATDMTAPLSDEADRRAHRAPCRSAASARPTRSPPSVAFLASDAAGYITGAVIPVDGGLGMGH